MRIAKYFIGILLAATGIVFVLATLVLVVEPDPEIPLWGVGVMFVVFAVLPWQAHLHC